MIGDTEKMPTVLVTGAGRGIGRAIALRLAAAGWEVHAGVRSPDDGAELARTEGRIHPHLLDVTDPEAVAALPDALPERLDALVNNAGIFVGGPLEAVAVDELRRQLEVNVTAQLAVTQAVMANLRAARGRVVFVSSVSGRVSWPFAGPYNASKFALEGMADALRLELREWGIDVVLVEPGAVDTDMWRGADRAADAIEAAMAPEHRALYARQAAGMRKVAEQTQRRTAPPARVAAAVERALTVERPRARYVVGAPAKAQLALRCALPTRAWDALVARVARG